ncbi:transglycosylase [Arthrobacter sp. BF1]|uniref:aggregation-promoting factor C-terminal-like domain-containing protein n=1 Tax=Arthrobacter sp. BF1 TaxID=2821145 RepID=UPI001C4E4A50|nr:transglycosylase [Arthrobacter sp. BF1]
MSEAPQRGRRRAESASRPSLRSLTMSRNGVSRTGTSRTGTRAASPRAFSAVGTTAKCMAAVAVVGALMAAGSVASQTMNPVADGQNTSSLVAAVDKAAPSAISAPTDAAISFPGVTVTSKTSPTATAKAAATPAQVKVEANAVKPVTETPATKAAPAAPVDDPAAAKAFASSQLASFGWGADQMSCLTSLWQRESEWLTSAENVSSGAYGIAQSLPANKMESTGSDWATNYQTQIRWGMGYIDGRYGSPCGAWAHSESVGWY